MLGRVFLIGAMAVACSSGESKGGNPPGSSGFKGTVTGSPLPASADVVVVWSVVTGTDELYRFGGGTYESGNVIVQLSGPPPDAASNRTANGGALAVGVVALVPSGSAVPEGIIQDWSSLQVLALSARTSIVFRRGDVPEVEWASGFPDASYGCGSCVDSTSGFDTFTPMDCSELVLTTDSSVSCNWS